MQTQPEITHLLHAASKGDISALDEVVEILYDDLCAIARRQLRREAPGHTLDTSAVVHEAYFLLERLSDFQWQTRAHFLGMAGRIMRRVLVRYARHRNAAKRGGGARPVTLSEGDLLTESEIDLIVEVDDLLDRLDALGHRCRPVVECRVFAGMTLEETAHYLDVSVATVKRDWTLSRAWLNRAISDEEPCT